MLSHSLSLSSETCCTRRTLSRGRRRRLRCIIARIVLVCSAVYECFTGPLFLSRSRGLVRFCFLSFPGYSTRLLYSTTVYRVLRSQVFSLWESLMRLNLVFGSGARRIIFFIRKVPILFSIESSLLIYERLSLCKFEDRFAYYRRWLLANVL